MSKKNPRLSRGFFSLAAAAIIIAATIVAGSHQTAATAIAQQQDNQNNPAKVTAAETIIVTHNQYLRNFFAVIYRSFQDIPQQQKGSEIISTVRRDSRPALFSPAAPQPLPAYLQHM